MPWAPFYDYVADVWVPALRTLGVRAETELTAFGWYPIGRGEITASIEGLGPGAGSPPLSPLRLTDRGALRSVGGRAMASGLPAHVADRMASRARERLADLDPGASIACVRPPAACPGAAIFLTATYENVRAGFSASGERGKRAEDVADEAVDRLFAHHRSGAALDEHLADQILAPLCFASGVSVFTTARLSPHLRTNAWVIEQFGLARVALEEARNGCARVTVDPSPCSQP
jgi:RNA 3'-terminal phosphate cyclase (ATP)